MDRSTPDDGWNDAGDGAYPPAPIPAHERQWRHPSEMGQQAWVLSEPPITIGRGLLVATGTIGCLLGLAVLWMMLPAGGGAPVAEPTVTRSVDTAPRRTGAALTADLPATTFIGGSAPSGAEAAADSGVGSDGAGQSTTGDAGSAPSSSVATTANPPSTADTAPATTTGITLPAEAIPSNTVLLRPDEPLDQRAIAVLVGDSAMLITTTRAVEGLEATGVPGGTVVAGGTSDSGSAGMLDVRLDSGATSTATLVATSGSLAYLSPTDAVGTGDPAGGTVFGFANAAPASAGDTLFVLGDDAFSFVFDGGNRLAPPHDDVVEGTPVVDGSGDLVALCTHDGEGVAIVPVFSGMPSAPDTSASSTTVPGVGSTTTSPTSTAPTTSGTPGTSGTPVASNPSTSSTTPVTGNSSGSSATNEPTTSAAVLGLGTTGDAWIGVRLAVADAGGHAWITVTGVSDGSPAASAGLQVGQRIVSIDGRYLDSVETISSVIQAHRPGESVVLGVLPSWSTTEPPNQPVIRTTVVLGAREPSV